MDHAIWHIICWTLGRDTGERDIKVYTGSVAEFAIAFKQEGLRDEHGLTEPQIAKFLRDCDKDFERIYKRAKKLGIPITRHEPHPENIPAGH